MTSLILLIGCCAKLKVWCWGSFAVAVFWHLQISAEEGLFQSRKLSSIHILWKAPQLPFTWEFFHLPEVEKTSSLILFSTSKISMAFGISVPYNSVFTWLRGEQGYSDGYWHLDPGFSGTSLLLWGMCIELHIWKKLSSLPVPVKFTSRRLAVSMPQRMDLVAHGLTVQSLAFQCSLQCPFLIFSSRDSSQKRSRSEDLAGI